MDVSIVGDVIRWPFEFLGTAINFLLKYLIPILIIIGSLYFIYWIFSSGIITKISDRIILAKKKGVKDVVD
jgi:hypothetical protein